MYPVAGNLTMEIPAETQFFLAELSDDRYAVFVPLVHSPWRCSVQGDSDGNLVLVAETGDPAIVGDEVEGLFIAEGNEPFELIGQSAQAVSRRLNSGRLRAEKPLPSFVDQFGWCTWDSFYQEVSEDKVRLGLKSFQDGGAPTPLLILDDGWLSTSKGLNGEDRLSAFTPNHKFPNGLAPVVQMAKEEFGVKTFMVWHAFNGYWGGVAPESFPQYRVHPMARQFSPGIIGFKPNFNEWWGGIVGVVAPQDIYRFFQDFHSYLRKEGVDGLKVDVQSNVEGVAKSLGGRVEVMRSYRAALEGSAQTHFKGELINCMSCSNEMFYTALNSTITRTSTDFWPDIPESHGLHLYTNAQVSLWFGEFVHPDWDMFQSGHAMGAYHAAGRAVSGSPVYVSDKPNGHDFEVLRRLVLPDGSVLRANDPGRPTRDSLFVNPTKDALPLKIYNRNCFGGVLGAFNGRYGQNEHVQAAIRPTDVEGLSGETFAVYRFRTGELRILSASETWAINLPELEYEVFTVMPVRDGFSPLGYNSMLNGGGAVILWESDSPGKHRLKLRNSRPFLAYVATRPHQVQSNGIDVPFEFDEATQSLRIDLPEGLQDMFLRISIPLA